jgi:hypothetical protein
VSKVLIRPITLIACVLYGVLALAETPIPASVAPTLERAVSAHGGSALENLRTYREDYVINATVLGVGVYNFRVKASVDFAGRRGRLEFFNNGSLESIYQTTPQATQTWSKKDGLKPADATLTPKAGEPFTFSTPIKAGVLGLLAIGKTRDEKLFYDASLEVQGVKGPAIQREGKRYVVTYVFGADGTLDVEKSVFTNDKGEKSEFTLVYDKFKTVNGVKIPVGGAIYSSQIPGFASAKLEVTDVDVNPSFEASDFKMP